MKQLSASRNTYMETRTAISGSTMHDSNGLF